MKTVKVVFTNNKGESNFLITDINGSKQTIENYYYNNRFNISEGFQQVRASKVIFL